MVRELSAICAVAHVAFEGSQTSPSPSMTLMMKARLPSGEACATTFVIWPCGNGTPRPAGQKSVSVTALLRRATFAPALPPTSFATIQRAHRSKRSAALALPALSLQLVVLGSQAAPLAGPLPLASPNSDPSTWSWQYGSGA